MSLCISRIARLTILDTGSGFCLGLDSGFPYGDYPISGGLDYGYP